MCCGLWSTKKGRKLRRPEGARKVADKRMQIKARVGNVEEDIAQEGNANRGRALRWCLRNHEGRRRRGEKGGWSESEERRRRRRSRRRQRMKIERNCGETGRQSERGTVQGEGEGGMREARLKEGRSTRMVSK